MKLALRLGRTLEELGASMSSEEFSLWMALYEEDPWDETRGDLQAGIIAATIANYAGMRRADGEPPAEAIDYMPFLSAKRKGETGSAEDELDPVKYFSQFQ